MPYDPIQASKNGFVLFRGDEETATHCPKCKASRYVEVEGSDGSKKQSKIPLMVVRHLPVLPRLQRQYMTLESAKQMMAQKEELWKNMLIHLIFVSSARCQKKPERFLTWCDHNARVLLRSAAALATTLAIALSQSKTIKTSP